MAQVEVGFRTVFGHVTLSVLVRIQGSGVDIDIRIEFLHRYFVATRLEQTAQRCGCDALAKAGDDAAGDKNKLGLFFCHKISSSNGRLIWFTFPVEG